MRRIFNEITGRWMELNDKLTRVVSLSPAITEAFFACELGDLLVGVSTYCVHPLEARKKTIVGSYNTIKEDLLLKLNPEMIFITTGYQRDIAIQISSRYNVWVMPLPSCVSALIGGLVEAIIVAGYYDKAILLEENLLKGWENVLKLKFEVPIKAYYEIDLGGCVSFGAHSYITNAFKHLNIITPYMEYPFEWLEPKIEDIVKFNPDIIIYEPKMFLKRLRTIEEVQFFFRKRLESSGFAGDELQAIKDGRIIITPGIHDFFAHHGPSFILKALPWLMEQISNKLTL